MTMKDNLKITIIQTNIFGRDVRENLAMFGEKIAKVETTDLIILPEMFTTGFVREPATNYETMDGPTVEWLLKTAREKDAVIAGSIVIKEKGRFFNRLVMARRNGETVCYDKRHLFAFVGEDENYSSGKTAPVADVQGWNIRPFICYDLRFPVWGRNFGAAYDIAVYPANWPASRSRHWKTLLAARAIENQCCVVGVNVIGTDPQNISFSGDSCVISQAGEVVFDAEGEDCVETVELSRSALIEYRERFPFLRDADAPG